MKSSVITAEENRALNDLVRLIDPILFWTCNYEPTLSYSLSEDALFLTGIQDLYKFAIDTNCVLKGIAFNSKYGICKNLLNDREAAERLRATINVIQTLRAVIDHNQSELNGRISASQIDAYVSWMRACIGKDQPTNQDDFQALNEELRAMGKTLVASSREAIRLIQEHQNRNEIVSKWIEQILRWYCSGTRQEHYRGQLSDYYIATACASQPNFNYDIDPVDLRFKVNGLIMRQTTSRFDAPLRKLEAERRDIERASEHPSSQERALKEKFPELYDLAVENRSNRLVEINAEIEQIEAERSRFTASHRNLCDYFFGQERLYGQLRETMRELQEEGTAYTLLPQDFLQLDIERNCRSVR